MTKYYREGYPRPQFVRESFFSLNGAWNFRMDEEKVGEREGWQSGFADRKICVPFAYESRMSGIGEERACPVVWYCRTETFPRREKKRMFLTFEGADYRTKVWVNGQFVGEHLGGYTRFSFDITDALGEDGAACIVCRIEDSFSTTQLRGKQRWLDHNFDCWYTQTTGIWKDVWAEEVDELRLERVRMVTLYDEEAVEFTYELSGVEETEENVELETEITFGDEKIYHAREVVGRRCIKRTIDLTSDAIKWKVRYWRPGSPNLYDVCIRVRRDGEVVDEVGTYFGFRKISTDTGRICLNNMDIYLKMILDQGYWAESLLTPPSEAALVADLKKTLEYGYNGVRKHQKIEDERFYYWADVLGVLVWCECPSFYEFGSISQKNMTREWMQIVRQHENHPSIMAWVPFNESWGVPRIRCDRDQQNFTQAIYWLTKAEDATRPVISNDGWEHTKSDIITLHDYASDGESLLAHWKNPADNFSGKCSFNGERYAFANGFSYEGQPVILSEYGGIAYAKEEAAWGYGQAETSEEDYLARLKSLTDAIRSLDFVSGFCYTQLTDVLQEQNGHMTLDRREKMAAEKVREIIGG